MAISLSTIQNELDKAREKLKGVEENIKKSIGRDINSSPGSLRPGFKRTSRLLESQTETSVRRNEGIKSRLGDIHKTTDRTGEHEFRGRFNRWLTSEPQSRLRKVEKTEQRVPAKRRLGEQAAVTVFSRLSGPPKEDESDDKELNVKITSQVIVQDTPSRKEVLAAQNGDNQSKARNRRMFGALLGTLQKFRQEENQLKEKEDKRAQVEKKLEEAALREKEELKKKRQELFSSRRQQQIEIRQLEYKLLKLKQLSEWEETKKHRLNFILTSASPKIYYLPKVHNETTSKLLSESRKIIQDMIENKRAEVENAIADNAVIKKREKDEGEEIVRDMEEDEVLMDAADEEMGIIEEENIEDKGVSEENTIQTNGVSDKENSIEEEETDPPVERKSPSFINENDPPLPEYPPS